MLANLLEIHCDACGHRETLDRALRLRWLQKAGHLRRVSDPESPLIDELFRHQLQNIACPECQQRPLQAKPVAMRSTQDNDWSDWGMNRLCGQCRKPIPQERLEAIPEAKLCFECQTAETCAAACTSLSDTSCPRCGAWMRYATQTIGSTSYRLVCPNCKCTQG